MLKDLSSHPWPVRSYGADLALSVGCYTVLAILCIVVARQPGSIATIWLANGAAVALVASAPRERRLPMVLAGAVGNVLANLLYGDSLALALAFVPPNALEVALGAFLVGRTGRVERFAHDHGSFLRVLAAGAFAAPLLGATAGAATLQALGFAAFADVWVDWYIGASLGGVAMLPLMLALRGVGLRASLPRIGAPAQLLSLAVVAAATLLSLKYLPYPFVVIGVVLMVFTFVRPRLTTFANAPVAVASLGVALALGWFVPAGPDSQTSHALVFIAAMLVVVPAQVVSVVVARQRALSEMLSAVGSRVDDIIVFVDMDGIYRWVNTAREVYWGQPREQVLGRTWIENMGSEAYGSIVRPLFEQARAGALARRLVEFDYPARGRRTMDLLLQPARDEDGRQIGVLYCGTDVTELEASRRELLHSNRSLEQFVRISSHDLREPLNTIVQFCDLIAAEQGARLDGDSARYFDHVRGGAARMKVMLDDVLQYVRLDEGAALEQTPVDLDRIAAEVRGALAARIEATGAQLKVAALGVTRGSHALLSLVLQNLVSNAIKFVPPGRTPVVEVYATRAADGLRLCVKDNGIGIEARRIAELGTPFRRLHARRKYDGTGLGLAICKRIAEQLGGRLEIESQAGEGSCFALVLAAREA